MSYTLRHRIAAVAASGIPAGAWVELTGLTTNAQSIAGLSPGTAYDVEIIAVSDADEGIQSSAVAGGRWTLCPEPAAPSGTAAGYQLAVGDDVNGAVDVSWGEVDGAATYTVTHRPAGGTWTDVPGIAGTSIRIDGLAGATDHEVRLTAVNADGAPSVASGVTGDLRAVVATGGIVTTFVGDEASGAPDTRYIVHSFPSSGEFVLNATRDLDYLIIAGGGGGGGSFHGGGGGAGGFVTGTVSARSGANDVIVGAGGPGGARQTTPRDYGDSGGDSSVLGVTAIGGGGGGAGVIGATTAIGSGGGSGGGGAFPASSGAAGTVAQGNGGGRGRDSSNPVVRYGGGGGGAGLAGGAAVAGTGGHGGDGGAGASSAITGSAVTYAGGGGGNGHSSGGRAGLGGTGGGGDGERVGVPASPGTDGLGGGGGGADAGTGSRGGDGVVILRYPLLP